MSEWDTRRAQFLEEYKALIDKHFVDFFSYPVFMPNKEGAFEVRIQTEIADRKNMGVPSDIIVSKWFGND